MRHTSTVLIESENLILRRFTAQDADNIFNNWGKNSEVVKYLNWGPVQKVEITKVVLGGWLDRYSEDNFYQWGIELKSTGELVGSIGVIGEDSELDILEVGFCLGTPWWRQGITTEALNTTIKYLFEEVGANRIFAKDDARNEFSAKAMIKCGMKHEGTLRSSQKNNSGIYDCSIFAILKEEYNK